MRSKAFSAFNEQINTGDSLLLKYVNTVLNAKIVLLHPHVSQNLADYNAILNKETKNLINRIVWFPN